MYGFGSKKALEWYINYILAIPPVTIRSWLPSENPVTHTYYSHAGHEQNPYANYVTSNKDTLNCLNIAIEYILECSNKMQCMTVTWAQLLKVLDNLDILNRHSVSKRRLLNNQTMI